ncbi:MAG: alpha/beta hydrolase [Firmicutes bacterium]|nr:alpha/beta hydrolase [Bacillota bacterium]
MMSIAGITSKATEVGLPRPVVPKKMLTPIMDVSCIKRKWLDIAYATQTNSQKLDVYLPDDGEGPFPVVVLIHGGGWIVGDKRSDMLSGMLKIYSAGYAVVSVNYRLSGEGKWPAQIYDVKAAVRFIRANAPKYKLNPDKIAVMGESAGGHLAMLLGTTDGVKELEDLNMGNMDQSSRVQAVIDWYGVVNIGTLADDRKLVGYNSDNGLTGMEDYLFGSVISEIPDIVEKANPETYISPNMPPFFIQHGTADQVVPYMQSIRFADKAKKVGPGANTVILELLEGAKHGDRRAFICNSNIQKVLDFLDRELLGLEKRRILTLLPEFRIIGSA